MTMNSDIIKRVHKTLKEEEKHEEERQRKICMSKIPHKTYIAAEYAKEQTGRNLNVYKCKYCDFYHVGGNKKNEFVKHIKKFCNR